MEAAQQLEDRRSVRAREQSNGMLAGLRRIEPSSLVVPAAIVALAAALRLWAIGLDPPDPFYDAAVRSMGLSWHNFFFGALDPSGRLAIDKPPVDLWLQVASTKLLGFNRTALALPEALGGIAAVALLYAAISRAGGRVAGAIAALVLAVLPISVLTSRSDTMDSLMSALLVGALWSAIVAAQTRRARYVLLSAALVGLAFDVKLTLALVPVPALALLWWAASRRGRRVALAAATAGVLAVVAMAWAFTASLTPLSGRPFPIGSHTGSIYRAMFLFDGIERLTGASRELVSSGFASRAGVARLLGTGKPHYATLIGLELMAALVLLAGAGVVWQIHRKRHPSGRDAEPATIGTSAPTATPAAPATSAPAATSTAPAPATTAAAPAERTMRWLVASLIVWLATTYVLFSFMGHLQPRYLEAMAPAVAASLGIASAYLLLRSAGKPRVRVALIAIASLALLAGPAEASIDVVEEHAGDANPSGSGAQFGPYLRAHRDGARYEAVAANPQSVVALIAQDAQPVLVLRSVDGVLMSVSQLRTLVRERAVRYAIIPNPCLSRRRCTPTTAWTVRNSVMVRRGLYRYVGPSKLR
jgi:4-amino-4-deoxy-L-arabinose transferase-like glycosyltransferase